MKMALSFGLSGCLIIGAAFGQTPGTKLWEFPIGNSIVYAPAIGQDGTVYFAAGQYTLFAVNPDGSRRWVLDSPEQSPDWIFPENYPAVGDDGMVHTCGPAGRNYAIAPQGEIRWRFLVPDTGLSSPAIAADGTIVVGGRNTLRAQNFNGTVKWDARVSGPSSSSIGPDGTVYTVSGTSLVAINPDGSRQWEYAGLGAGGTASDIAIDSDGIIYALGSGGLHAVYWCGQRKWLRSPQGSMSSPLVGPDGTIYVGDDVLCAINRDGTTKWRSELPVVPQAIDADGVIYGPGRAGNPGFFAVNPDGTQRWQFTMGTFVYFYSTAIAGDGTIFAGYSGGLVALKGGSQLAAPNWPTFRRNSARTGSLQTRSRWGQSRGPDGGFFTSSLQGEIGRRYLIEVSTQVTAWTPLTVLTNRTGTMSFSDATASRLDCCFYRARPVDFAPSKIGGRTITLKISGGDGVFAQAGSYRFVAASVGNSYTITPVSGTIAPSHGTFSYTKVASDTAMIVIDDALRFRARTHVRFTSPQTGAFVTVGVSGIEGTQTGTAMTD